jgi:hypothetical protein
MLWELGVLEKHYRVVPAVSRPAKFGVREGSAGSGRCLSSRWRKRAIGSLSSRPGDFEERQYEFLVQADHRAVMRRVRPLPPRWQPPGP